MSIPAAAENIGRIGALPVTNSLLTGWVLAGLFVAFGLAVRAALSKRMTVPRGIQNAVEAAIEALLGAMDQVTHDRAKSRRFLPFVGTLFPLILVSNWMGLLPGLSAFGFGCGAAGECVPLFRPATSDLNMTLALGITAVVVSHVIGIMSIGLFRHWGKFVQVAGVWEALLAIGRKPLGETALGLFTAVLNVGVGLLELVSEAAKMLSLSLRLFGNIFAGEVLLHVMSTIMAFLLPTPFMFMELIVGVVQALVFSILTLVYLTLATEPPHGEHHAHEEKEIERREEAGLPPGFIPPRSMGEEDVFPMQAKAG